jgi:hypothetical protein
VAHGLSQGNKASVAEERFIVIATFLPVRRWADVVRFLVMSFRVARQAKKTPGLVKYALKADFPLRRFWTLTVWNNRESIRAFVTSEPHKTAVQRFSKWAGEGSAFAEWTSEDGSINWQEGFERLKAPTFYYKR